MPVRHEDDFRRKYIKSWDQWVDDAIRDAEERGEFENLPDKGKRIHLEETPFAPEMASALRTLKNAGYQPLWMELDKEITNDKRKLQAFLERSIAYIEARRAEVMVPASSVAVATAETEPSLWARIREWLLHGDGGVDLSSRSEPLTLDDIVALRSHMREQYMERAAAIDKKIGSFHAALPRNLWHLERMRLTQEDAARTFDVACPPVVGEQP